MKTLLLKLTSLILAVGFTQTAGADSPRVGPAELSDQDKYAALVGEISEVPYYSNRKMFDSNAVFEPKIKDFSFGEWNSDIVVALEDGNDIGSTTVIHINLETMGADVSNNNDGVEGLAPFSINARVESEVMGDADVTIDSVSLAAIGSAGISHGAFLTGAGSGKFLELRMEENTDEETEYDRAYMLNIASAMIDYLVAQGNLPGSNIETKVFLGTGLSYGVAKADLSEAKWRQYNVYKLCAGVQFDFSKTEIAGEYCVSQVDASTKGLLDDSRTHDAVLSARFKGTRISVEAYGQKTEFDNGEADKERAGLRARVRFGRTK